MEIVGISRRIVVANVVENEFRIARRVYLFRCKLGTFRGEARGVRTRLVRHVD